MKKVLIDLTQVPLQRTGVGIYALNYVRCLQTVAAKQQLYFLIQDDDIEMSKIALGVPGAIVIRLKSRLFRRYVVRLLTEQIIIPAIALFYRLDIVHSLHYSFPLVSLGCFKRIVTVCDMSFFLFPELHVAFKRRIFQFFIRHLYRVDGLLFISTSSLDDFNRFFPKNIVPKQVIPLGVDRQHLATIPDAVAKNRLFQHFEIEKYILYVGTIEPRKNILGLVKAFESIAAEKPTIKLVIAGKLGWDYSRLLRHIETSTLRDHIVLAGYVTEADKHILLKSALLFVYVSFYEGFGLPVLEGMAAGTPTITSNLSSMPEVAGDGALLVDPNDTVQIASAMLLLLNDAEARMQLVTRGLSQSRLFTWEQMTRISLDFYEKIVVMKRKLYLA